MSYRSRLSWILVVAVLAVLAATALTAGRASQRIRDDIERARGAYLLNTLKNTVDSNLAIGLTLEQMGMLQTLIEREKGGANDVLAIDVFLPDATLLYSTDRGVIGAPVGEDWVARLATDETWQIATRGETVLGARVDTDLGTPAGGIAVTLADDDGSGNGDLALWTKAWPILQPLLPVAAVAVLLAIAAAMIVTTRMMRPFHEVALILSGASPDDSTTPAGSTEHAATGHAVTGHAVTGHATTGHATTGHAVTGHATTGHAVTGYAVTGYAVTGYAVTGYAVTGNAATGHAATADANATATSRVMAPPSSLFGAAHDTRRAWAAAERHVAIATAGLREIDDVQ
ncbi:hypothetical protein [Pigmentiphaga litoralis]|uniref:Uncharacterized protein n=1 Tax=Pigmentiphaga litoralis TaxID=516702 RepID=A0A7Y9IXQ8_9BURK|nr:hypothetical protein [Pigmentiphaga litoralis]NYE25920.1 hypothetical protein [Pigmentiphaga litoralis]NYE85040.1 hypothetical protein [Pigmentiphaga litoralis]